jgi:transcriptional regulator GlxA family with amidase domain
MDAIDEAMKRAAERMKSDLARKWTVTALAKTAAMSRPVFARRFLAAFGAPPLHYLIRLRMETAAERLETTNERLASIARSVGYETEFALSRAFRRHFGVPPAFYRRHVRSANDGRTTCLAA